jgi:hypothetical protein
VAIVWRLPKRSLNKFSTNKRGLIMIEWIDIRIGAKETTIIKREDKGRITNNREITLKEETTGITSIKTMIGEDLIITGEITLEEKEMETKDILKYFFMIKFFCGNNLFGLYWDIIALLLLCSS